jgi:hypothetical protein
MEIVGWRGGWRVCSLSDLKAIVWSPVVFRVVGNFNLKWLEVVWKLKLRRELVE